MEDETRAGRIAPELGECANISATGSVIGMQRRFGWPRKGQVRIGRYIYNVGPAALARLRAAHLIRGERT
jgi:hypothetical protein